MLFLFPMYGYKRDGRCGDQIKAELHRFSDQWIDSASSCDLHYRPSYNSPVTGDTLMITNHNEATDNCGPAVMTPNSMRNIEEEVKLFRIEL